MIPSELGAEVVKIEKPGTGSLPCLTITLHSSLHTSEAIKGRLPLRDKQAAFCLTGPDDELS
jgi:hypothetical protein